MIGEQASGKSTIAKLIYFSKSLRDDLFNQIYSDSSDEGLNIVYDLIVPIREKFYDFFGSTFHLPEFEIKFYYSVEKDKYLRLTLNNSKKIHAEFSSSFLTDEFKFAVRQIKRLLQTGSNSSDIHEQLAYEQNKIRYAQRLSILVNALFESSQTDSLFVIAGRNATVSYSEWFEKYLFASVQNSLEENARQSFKRKQQTIDETLMLKFMERVGKIKDTFKKFENFEGLIESFAENGISKIELQSVRNRIDEILKGRYVIDNYGEKIIFDQSSKEYVYLSNASSGQQESIRILQDIFINILDNVKILRILEEPEAHLFPTAQKQLIELLALMISQNVDNQLIITTHSPYVLTAFNNLLFAKRVIDKNPSVEKKVNEVIPEKYHINASDFAAYSLGNSAIQDKYCEPIFSIEKGIIQQNYLDTVSEILGKDFNALYQIHAEKFARK